MRKLVKHKSWFRSAGGDVNCYELRQNSRISKKLVCKKVGLTVALLFFSGMFVFAQTLVVDKKNFFIDEHILEMDVVTDMKKLVGEKLEKDYATNFQPATLTCRFADSTKVTEEIEIRARGKFRREECYVPSIMVNFKTPGAVIFKKLGKLKFVWPCSNAGYDEQLVLKEYLVYKIYNLLTDKSFRVRLVKLGYYDVNEKMKPRKLFGFFIEDVDDMAKRNSCEEVEPARPHTESTDKQQTTLVSLFQYMIGNTDWAVPVYQNIKLIRSKEDTLSKPFVVPYDFDYSGMVNANYAIPLPELGIESVTQRLYRGFPRTMDELKEVIQIYQLQRPAIDSLVKNFKQLESGHKKEMIKYIDDFFKIIANEKDIRYFFVSNARTK
jgi:hypothetical protein